MSRAPWRFHAPLHRLAAGAALLVLLCAGAVRHAEAQAPPPAVGVRPVELRGVARVYDFVGRVGAINTLQVRARVEGFLDKVMFTEGQEVTAGQPLYQIEKSTYQARVEQAQANLASAKAQAVNAELQYNRSLELVRSQYTPQSTVDQNRATLDSARASVQQNQAALDLAQINLGYTEITSPIAGRIGRTTYTQGNLVNPASGVLATVVSQDPMYVLFPVGERQLEEIRKSRRQENGSLIKIDIVVRLSTGEEYPHTGVWNFTDTQVDQGTDTVLMRATVPNPERRLIDGALVTAEIRERQEQPRLVISQAALQLDQAGTFVLVVDSENKVEMRRVTLGPPQDADIVVQSGLKEGEKVIVDGIQKVRVGQVVNASVMPAKGS